MAGTNKNVISKILVEVVDHIKTITINNPKAKNAISPDMSQALYEAVSASEHDGTRVIILTGAEGSFCSGAALGSSDMQNPKEYDVTKYLREIVNRMILSIHHIDIPVIAKVEGVAVGLGANIALACDMVYATKQAVFSQIFTNIALSSDGGGAFFMPQSMGYKKAFELMTTAAKFSGEDALSYGLINHALEADELNTRVQEIAEKLANGPFVAIQKTKVNLRQGIKGDLAAALDTEAVNQKANFMTDDFIEGVMAFMQKRKPNFKGK